MNHNFKTILSIVVLATVLYVPIAYGYSSGPPDNRAGNPPANANCTQCHSSFPLNSGSGSLTLSGLPTTYTPSQTYSLSLTLSDSLALRWGFELTSLDPSWDQGGTFTITDATNTQLSDHAADSADFIKQTSTGTYAGSTGSASWNFDWTAPASTNDITFYFAGNGANNNGFNTLDYIYTDTYTVSGSTNPNFTVTLTYNFGSPVPAGGGAINFDVFLQNNEATSQNFDLWIEIPPQITPPGVPNRNLTFPSGFSITRPDMNWPIPAGWPAGNYQMVWSVGELATTTAWATDSFPFVKSADDDGSGYALWEVDGDPLDQLFEDIDYGESVMVSEFALLGSYPNPFNPTTTINYTLDNSDLVKLSIYDLSGREIATLVDGYRDAGAHEVNFDASGLASGVYIYRLTSGQRTVSNKMVLTK